MDRYACRIQANPLVVRPQSSFPICYSRIGLLLIGLNLVVNTGCTNSGAVRRLVTAIRPYPAKSPSRKQDPDISADRPVSAANVIAQSTSKTGDVQLVSDEETNGGSSTVDQPTAPSVYAGDVSGNAPIATVMTLDDLQILAVQNNPTLAQAQAAITAEQGFYRQAGLYPNPQIGYLNGTATNPAVRQSNGLFLSQEFVTAHKLQLAQQSALVEIQRYTWDHESQRLRILNDLRIRYYEVLGAQNAVNATDEMVKLAEKATAMAERHFESKQGTKTDLLQSKVHLETVRLTHEEAVHRYQAAWGQLATIAGVASFQPVPLVGDLTADIPELDLESCQQVLMASSPQIRSTECDLGHAWATHREARAQAYPNVTVQTVSEYDRATQAATVSTLVAMPLPIYNRNQGNIDKTAADVAAAQAEVCRVQLVLRDQLADSFRRYQTSRRQMERLRDVILPTAKENLELTEQVYQAGETGLTPVMFAQQSYFQNQMAYVEALTELHKVVVEIQGLQLTGGLNPAAIGGAIQNQPGGGSQRQRALLNEVQDRASKQLLPAAQIGQ